MRKTYISILLIFLLFFVLSCNNDVSKPNSGDNASSNISNSDNTSSNNSNSDNSNNSIKRLILDLNGASTLYIGKSSQSSSRDISSSSSQNKIFKVTEDGYSQEVIYYYETDVYDDKGNLVEKKKEKVTEVMVPEKLIKLNENYLIVSFGNTNNYLVDTKTGYCFNYTFNTPNIDSRINYFTGEPIQFDSEGNIYYIVDNKIMKISISDPQSVSIEQISPSIERISSSWGVDLIGNCAYKGSDELENGVVRFKKASGGYVNLPGDTNRRIHFWQGLDGNIYYYNDANPGTGIKKIDKTSYEIIDVPYSEGSYISGACGFSALLKVKNKNRIILVEDGSAYPFFHEVYNPDTNIVTTKKASDIGLNKIKFAVSSDDFYYFVGSDENNNCKVVKVDPVTYQYEYLLSDGEYDVYNLTVSKNSIVFNALRMSDGAIVMGRINNNGNIKILDDKLENMVTVLERIN